MLQDFHKDSELDGFTEMIRQHLKTVELLCCMLGWQNIGSNDREDGEIRNVPRILVS